MTVARLALEELKELNICMEIHRCTGMHTDTPIMDVTQPLRWKTIICNDNVQDDNVGPITPLNSCVVTNKCRPFSVWTAVSSDW